MSLKSENYVNSSSFMTNFQIYTENEYDKRLDTCIKDLMLNEKNIFSVVLLHKH